MFMIQNSSKKRNITLISCLYLLSIAQTAAAQELPWPRTFVGQPDFEFLRDEVAQEFRKRKGDDAYKYIATLNTLFVDREIDPFTPTPITADIGRSKYSKTTFESLLKSTNRPFRSVYPNIEIGSGVNVKLADGRVLQAELLDDNHVKLLENDRKIKIEVNEKGDIVEAIKREDVARQFDLLFTRNVNVASANGIDGEGSDELQGLPEFSLNTIDLPELEDIDKSEQADLEDFLSFLENILTQASKKGPKGLENRDYIRDISGISIQSIVTQPLQYVIINHRRYNVGDNFTMRIKIADIPKQDLGATIDEYIPSKDEIGEKLHKHYLSIKEEALKQYEEKSAQDENEEGKSHDISVMVKEIKRRQVIFSIFEQDYPVKMKFML